ncbi:DNA-binding LytR/AlgR family response regulator [Aquimarina sp. EL_43]|uniref:LytR/AlgR family response regulator transcription factor n=1 Tax=Aquimarina TaxID=290174 RepID=UPI000470A69F|nr:MULTISPECIES: LytTR family DNA-binding domain-containing protein [Aquimarina]MBG6129642.1 DNA-binding LytR/AlgR family response regulator [Aquimarina sp. EL_35]MBG6150707.1 DNA-binding LytR/AlgR family response regulator [Aquimarina sp. EL_32]MBG6167986.1 DNA-binding LytR/AlgR family response regulator [Aquimarina sp. EL_43]
MEILKCIIADDEPIARQILENYIEQIPNLEVLASCKDAFEVMKILQNQSADILFLDINMPKLSGLSLLKTMQKRPDVIITTAYPEYAIEGFELSVTDYLLKPFSLERFIQAVTKIQKKNITDTVGIHLSEKEEIITSVFVKSDKKLIKVLFKDIQYIEAYGNYIKIFTDTMILTPNTLSDFFDKLPKEDFIRIHKSYVINFNELKLIEGNQLILNNTTTLPIGKSYRKLVLDKIDGM